MAYPDPGKTEEIQQRCHDFADSGKKSTAELQLSLLERDFGYFLRDADSLCRPGPVLGNHSAKRHSHTIQNRRTNHA